jgi:hypothetical protein
MLYESSHCERICMSSKVFTLDAMSQKAESTLNLFCFRAHLQVVSIIPSEYRAYFFSFGATAPIRALAYLHEALRFTPVLQILDSR